MDDRLLGARVDARGRLVQDEDRRVAEHGARDGEELALAGAHGLRVAGEHGVVALRQRADEEVDMGRLSCGDDLLARGAGAAVGDVLGHGPLEEPGVLEHHAKLLAQVAGAHLARVAAVERDVTAVDLVEAHEEIHERRLAGARRAHDGNLLAGLRHERDVAHEGALRRVAEAHVLEGDTTLDRLGGLDGVRGVRLDLVFVEQAEDALRCGEGTLQHVHGERGLRERLGRVVEVLEECLEDAHGKATGKQHLAPEERDHDLRQTHDEADGRADGLRQEVRERGRRREPLRGLADLRHAGLVAAERLDDGAAGVRLLHAAGEFAERRLPRGRRREGVHREEPRHEQRHRGERREYERELEAHGEHEDNGEEERQARVHDLHEAALQNLADLVEVVRGAADRLARLVAVEVRERQALELGRDLLAKLEVQALRKARHDEGVDGVEGPGERPETEEGQDLGAAVLEGDDVALAAREALLDVAPQKVDEAGAVGHGAKLQRHEGHGEDAHEDEPPALAGGGVPKAHGRGDGICRHLELLLGLGRLVLELLFVTHGWPPS